MIPTIHQINPPSTITRGPNGYIPSELIPVPSIKMKVPNHLSMFCIFKFFIIYTLYHTKIAMSSVILVIFEVFFVDFTDF